jgi:hypothetical protein
MGHTECGTHPSMSQRQRMVGVGTSEDPSPVLHRCFLISVLKTGGLEEYARSDWDCSGFAQLACTNQFLARVSFTVIHVDFRSISLVLCSSNVSSPDFLAFA